MKSCQEIFKLINLLREQAKKPAFDPDDFHVEVSDGHIRIKYLDTLQMQLYPIECNVAANFLRDWHSGKYSRGYEFHKNDGKIYKFRNSITGE